MLTGQCHCGNVQFSVPEKPESLTACTCSICHRYGVQWMYYSPSDVTVSTKNKPTQRYRWGDEMIDFHHCPTCGCVTHYTGTEHADASWDRMALNARMCARSDTSDIPVKLFDGADTWAYLEPTE